MPGLASHYLLNDMKPSQLSLQRLAKPKLLPTEFIIRLYPWPLHV